MNKVFQPEWRTQNRLKRKFYAKYMSWLERAGYCVVLCVFGAFIFAFNYKVEDVISAENVKIEPYSVPVEVSDDALVLKVLVTKDSTVVEGQPIAEVILGEAKINQFLTSAAARPPAVILRATAAGTVRFNFKPGSRLEKGAFATILDYTRLRLSADLKGQSVSKAQAGDRARITAITIPSSTDTLFRGAFARQNLVSGELLGKETKTILEESLKNEIVHLRDDRPLQLDSVKQVQVDAEVRLVPTTLGKDVPVADPPAGFTVFGTVVSGVHQATVQIADLPAPTQERLNAAVRAHSVGKSIQSVDGKVWQIADLSKIGFVVQATAEGGTKKFTGELDATMLDRAFAAKIDLDQPPPFLIKAVRDSDSLGKSVTARVELVTGTKPIAFILLKRS